MVKRKILMIIFIDTLIILMIFELLIDTLIKFMIFIASLPAIKTMTTTTMES